ncbi:MAG: alginate lyase family protein [Streptosporangiaceae bacterium]
MNAPRQSRLAWYARRLGRMSPAEVTWRLRDKALQAAWLMKHVKPNRTEVGRSAAGDVPPFTARLPECTGSRVPEAARSAVLAAAEKLLAGEWEVLGFTRTDMVAPDWFFDPVTGRRAPAELYAFRIDHRSEELTGNVKQIWEISRLQHLTLLATAYFLSHDDAYAQRVSEQLRSWWEQNPFLSGVNWTSGIEVGIRLISMAWIRRLLDDWPRVTELFEHNELAVRQIRWHQQYLAAFRSRGSSANNHVVAEAAGQLVASCAFPWFAKSKRWRSRAARLLERELERNTFPSGINRELASDYQCFVAELGILAAVEGDAAGFQLSEVACQRLCAMIDSSAALLDATMRPPRQGDGDEGRALLLDAPVANRWPSLLGIGAALFGRLEWWPRTAPDAASSIIASLPGAAHKIPGRPAVRPWRFADAGMTLLRTTTGDRDPEIWCRCDGGPHGFLSIAAHAHADALSVEVRYGGVDVLADPGTYCYHGERAWRSYFRSTIAHNTVELDGRSQSSEGGPFLWLQHANALEKDVVDIGDAVEWTAEHHGYKGLDRLARHRRCVRLDRATRSLDIVDEVDAAGRDIRLAFHLGPEIEVEIDRQYAILRWPEGATPGSARLELPRQLRWSVHRGETNPILGWYSPGLGRRMPAVTLIGRGCTDPATPFTTRLEFFDLRRTATVHGAVSDVSWLRSDAIPEQLPDARAEAG